MAHSPPDAVDKTESQLNTSKDWIKFEKSKPIVLRILPPIDGEELPWEIIHQHFHKTSKGKAVPYNCPNKMNNNRCPGCEEFDRLIATGNPADEELAKKEWRAGSRGIARAIARNEPDLGVRPVGLSATVIKALNAYRKGNDLNPGLDFTDAENGYDIVVERLGKQPWYKVDVARASSPIAQTAEGLQDIIEQMRALPLKPFAKVLSYEQIQEKIAAAELAEGSGGSANAPATSIPTTGRQREIGGAVDGVNDSKDPF